MIPFLTNNLGMLKRLGVLLVAAYFLFQYGEGQKAIKANEALKAQVQTYQDAAADRALAAKAEAARLAAEQEDRNTFGRLSDEAMADPSAATPSIGVRSVDRLNAIR